MNFEYDPHKSEASKAKRGINFEEAQECRKSLGLRFWYTGRHVISQSTSNPLQRQIKNEKSCSLYYMLSTA